MYIAYTVNLQGNFSALVNKTRVRYTLSTARGLQIEIPDASGRALAVAMSATSPVIVRPNLLAHSGGATTPFVGDQRIKARNLLATKVQERQVMAVMQLVNRDPSLALDTVPMALASGGVSRVEEVDFAVACIQHDLAPGYVFAVSHGYDVNKPMHDGLCMLDIAVSQISLGGAEAHVSLLLALGADPNGVSTPGLKFGGTFSLAMSNAYQAKQPVHHSSVITMLLDAKVTPSYPPVYKCPISLVIAAGGWDDKSKAAEHTHMMARLVKAGAPLDQASGSPRLTPLQFCLGSKNGAALEAVVRLGCNVSSDTLKGKDLFAEMDANGLAEFKPAIQRALMERVIAQGRNTTVAATITDDASNEAPRPRRRLGAL
jgi:hypothetical protein